MRGSNDGAVSGVTAVQVADDAATSATPTRYRVTVWLSSRAILVALVLVAAATHGVDRDRRLEPGTWLLFRLAQWDSHLYAVIALRGYTPHGPASHYIAFFPGFPALMLLWTFAFGSDGRWGALIVVVGTGVGAAVLMGKLADASSATRIQGDLAVWLMTLAPLTIYFSAIYTEAVFLCLSLGAWLCGQRRLWGWAGVLAGLTCTLRINGLFLVAALCVMFLCQRRSAPGGSGVRYRALSLFIGPMFILAWTLYLHGLTGQWDAWSQAQRAGWGRHLAWPWTGMGVAIHSLVDSHSWELLLTHCFDLLALLVAVAAPIFYLRRRDWPAATLVGLGAFPIVFSSIPDSGARYILVWFPLYLTAARWLEQHPRVTRPALVLSGGLALVVAYMWSQGYWIA